MSFSHCAVIAEGLHPELVMAVCSETSNCTPIGDPSMSIKIVYRRFVSEIFLRILAKVSRWAKNDPSPLIYCHGLGAMLPAMHGQTLGAQVALLQSPIPPAAGAI